jgi:hypothetical protein
MSRASRALERVIVVVVGLSGLLITCRILWGPLTFPVRVNSPLNAESWFAAAGVLLLLVRSVRNGAGERAAAAFNRFDLLAIITLTLMVAGVFARSAHSYFLSDDFLLLKHVRAGWQNLGYWFTVGGGDGFFRPIGYASLVLGSTRAGTDPGRWHWIGFALHAANGILVFLFARALALSRIGAWIAAALFAVHATRPEAVVWMAGRFDLVATLFVLLALVAFLRSLDVRPGKAAVYRCVSLGSMTLGMLSKESAYACAPMVLVLLLSRRLPWMRRALLVLPYLGVTAGLFAYRWTLFGGIGGYPGAGGQPLSITFASSFKAISLRLWAILFFPINWAVTPGLVLRTMAAIYVAALLWLFLLRIPRTQLVVPLGLVLVAALPPLSQLLIGADLQKSRLLYLPSVFFCLFLATAIEHAALAPKRTIAAAAIAFNLVALGHNLSAWEYASVKAKAACLAAARCVTKPGDKIAVRGLPGSLNGVYFFSNGFPECVALQGPVSPADVDTAPEAAGYACLLSWDRRAGTLIADRR